MSYEVKQGNIFGRIGSGVGQGLAEQIPKEIENYRLRSGLKNIADEADEGKLSPAQFLARTSGTYGITPQMVQSFGELAKNQAIRNVFTGNNTQEPVTPYNPKKPLPQKGLRFSENEPGVNIQNDINVSPNEYGQPQISPNNPLRESAVPRPPWTPERRKEEIGKLFQDFPYLTLPEAQAMAADNEARELAQPEAQRAIDNYYKQKQDEATNKFDEILGTKLQKSKEGVYSDITGEMKNNLIRGMERELRENPKASVNDVANKWSEKALDMAKTKTQLNKLAGTFGVSDILNKKALNNKLKEYQESFAKANNQEEYFNLLKSDFKMSPQGAASIAYPRNKGMKSYISGVKNPKSYDPSLADPNARKQAIEIEKLITANDSLLAIARDLREKVPFFDQTAFFEQLGNDKDQIGLTPRQQREIQEGVSNILPSWADLLILPLFRGL